MVDVGTVFLAGAGLEFANGWYNNCASRCYYACFQAAIHALIRAGMGPGSTEGQWGHAYVQAEFVGQLINRRKEYPPSLRDALIRSLELRLSADYRYEMVTSVQASRALRRAQEFVRAVRAERP